MNDASGAYSYAYGLRDRLLTNSTPAGTLIYNYDANGDVTNIISSTTNGTSVTYQYDALNRLTNVVDARLTGTQNTAYGFDAVGNLQRMQYPNSVTNVYQYDSLNRLTNLVWKTNGTIIASFAYTLGVTGNRTALSETVSTATRSFTWQYDTLYRLTNEAASGTAPAGTLGYGYDVVGNRTNRTGTLGTLSAQTLGYNTNDWLTSDVYDSNGNTRTNASLQPYQYDYENRLTNFNNGQAVYYYDADGNRVKKIAGGKATLYLVDTRNPSGYAQVMEELTATGTTNFYTYGLDLISQRTPGSSPSTNFFTSDGHGSTRYLSDKGGKLVNAFAFDAYGTLVASNSTPQTAYLYCGEQFDTDLGFHSLRARYLNPATGRFWTMDTYAGNNEDPLSLHKYLYCHGNPVNMTDPLGKWVTFIHKEAIDRALQTSVLPASDRQILKEEQDEVDQDQKAVDSYRHAMSDGSSIPPQTAAEAQQEADQHVGDWLTKARAAEAKNEHTTALQYLGQAMHALQDSTSPAHHGFQPWYDYPGGEANPHEWCHGAKESINPGQESWLYIATGEAYDYFHDTSKPLPSDFFNDLGADSPGTGIKRWFNPFMDIIPDANISFTISDIGGFAF